MTACENTQPHVTLFLSGPACGKTTALLEEVHKAESIDQSRVLFITACDRDCQTIKNHIGTIDSLIQVTSIQNLARNILNEPEAHEIIGRSARILDSVEEGILFEDMRSLGIKQRRLRGLCSFIQRGWSDLADEDERWLQTLEEELVAQRMRENLQLVDGILPCELEACALRVVSQCERIRNAYQAHAVFVDDFTLMGRASQQLVRALATQELYMAASDAPGMPVADPYPFERGVKELLEASPDTQTHALHTCYRPTTSVSIINKLRTEAGRAPLTANDERKGTIETHYIGGFAEEQEAILRTIDAAHAQGTSLSRIAIVGANGVWRATIARVLRSNNITVTTTKPTRMRIRDYRDAEANKTLECKTLEQLSRDPENALAWRTWCALGDYLANSVGIDALRAPALRAGFTLPQALNALLAGKLDGLCANDPMVEGLLARYRAGLDELHARDAEATYDPANPPAEREGVLLCNPRELQGQTFDLVIFGGFVNGFFPSRAWCENEVIGTARTREAQLYRTQLASVAASATNRLVFTGFTTCSLETAERLDLCVERIRLTRGIRMAAISPSRFLSLVH